MIELNVEQEYAIDHATIAAAADVPLTQVDAFYTLNAMAMPDGRLAIGLHVWFEPDRLHAQGSETFQVDLDVSGGVRVRDLAEHFSKAYENSAAAAVRDMTLYLTGTDKVLVVPSAPDEEPYELHVAQTLGSVRVDEGRAYDLSPGYAIHPVAEGNVVAFPLQAGSSTEWLAFLSLDLERRTATWSAFPEPIGPSAGGSILKRLFGAKSVPPKATTGDDLLQLAITDFPHRRGFETYRPHINQALLRDGRVYVLTKGSMDTPKSGYPCSVVAEIGSDGRVKSRPFMRDYTTTGDEKKYGIEGRFTSSGRYCILTSAYKTTDPWKGQQKLLDMDSGELIDLKLPRGFGKYRLINHAGDHFWAELWPVARGETRRFVRFSV